MSPGRPTVLLALIGASSLTAAASAAGPMSLPPVSDSVSPDAATQPVEQLFGRPRPVDPAILAQLAGRPIGLRGDCPELVDLNGPIDGDMPREVAFLPDGSAAVIVNRDSNNVTYLDPVNLEITGQTPVGEFPVFVTVTPNGQYILTANVLSNSVSVVDAATRTEVAEIPITGTQPYRIAVTSDSSKAVVGVINNAEDATFSVIDLATLTEVSTFPGGVQGVYGGFANSVFPIFGNIFGQFALAPDDRTIVLPAGGVPSNSESTIFFFDITTGTQTASILGPQGARAVDISADGSLAAVTYSFSSQRIDVIDMATQSVASSIPTSTQVDAWIRFSPDASKLVTGYLNDTFIIDRATGSEIFRTVTGTIGDVEITHDGNYVVIPNFTTRIIDLNSPSVVAAMSHAATAEMAVSPVAHLAVGLNNRFGENAHVYNTNGASGSFLAAMPTGTFPEGDAPFEVAISADGQTAVIGMTLSGSVAIVDVPTRTMRSLVHTGARVMDVEITPDGSHAVICDGDSDQVSIIDLSTDEVVATLPIFSRPAQVAISADGSTAYVLNIAGVDNITFINLDGASSSIVGSVPAGQTGSWNGIAHSENSAIELSPDGSLLAVCDSFNDLLLLIDTATRTQVAAVPVGDFPIRVAFSPDGTRAYVTNVFSHDLSVVNVDGASSSLVTTTPIANNAFTVSVDSDGAYVYITNSHFQTGSELYVYETATNSVVSVLTLDGRIARDAQYDAASDTLYVAARATTLPGDTGMLYRFSADGAATAFLDATPLSDNPYDLEYSPASGVAIVSQPWIDGADFLCFEGAGCPADWNGDDAVNSNDISAFLSAWLSSIQNSDLIADFNGDSAVNSNDISAFLSAWLDAINNGC